MKIKFGFKLFCVFLLTCFYQSLTASHIVGGELNYKCLGQNRIELKMTIYRDCRFGNPSVWFDNPAIIGIFNSDNQLVTSLGKNGIFEMALRPINDTLIPTLSNPCFALPPHICVHSTTYIDTLFLPPIPGGYTLAYQRCCRNQTIVNLIEPGTVGATFSIWISEEALITCNNSPTFNSWPPIYICNGEPIDFDHSATDLEGDSIVYRLCTPLSGGSPLNPIPNPPLNPPFDLINWKEGFDLANMLGSQVPLKINPETGFMTGIPDILGQFVVGVCIDEYRDGVLLSVIRRDFQYNVGLCGHPLAAFFIDSLICDKKLQIQNQSQFNTRNLWILKSDEKEIAKKTTFNFQAELTESGSYELCLIVEPGTSCADTFCSKFEYLVWNPAVEISITQFSCSNPIDLQLSASSTTGTDTALVFTWKIIDNSDTTTLEGRTQILTQLAEAELMIKLIILDTVNLCSDTLVKFFKPTILSLNDLDSIHIICPGDTLLLKINTSLDILWDDSPVLLDPLHSKEMRVVTNSDIRLGLVLTDQNLGCSNRFEIAIFLSEILNNIFVSVEPDTIFVGQSTQLMSTLIPGVMYRWSPSTYLNRIDIPDPIAFPSENTVFTLNTQDSLGCQREFTIPVVVLQTACDANHIFIPNAFSPNGDSINDSWNVRSQILDNYILILYNRWGEEVFRTQDLSVDWDGTHRGKPAPKGTYAYYFEGLCVGGQKIVLKGDLSVF